MVLEKSNRPWLAEMYLSCLRLSSTRMVLSTRAKEVFILRREMQSILCRGPIVSTYKLFRLWNVYGTFISVSVVRIFEILFLRMAWDGIGWDGMGWTEYQESLNFIYNFRVYSPCIYIFIHIPKNCHQYSYEFQNFMSTWGSWSKI